MLRVKKDIPYITEYFVHNCEMKNVLGNYNIVWISLLGAISSVVLVGCPSARLERLLVGSRGMRIRVIAKEAEQELQKTFMQPVRLKLVVTSVDRTVPNVPPDRQRIA